jgi:hypothetical protein
VKTPPPSISFWSLRSDPRSERSKTKDSLSFVTDATSLRGVSIQSYCCTVPKKKAKLPLSKTHPKLAEEAYGWDPSQFSKGSHQKVDWRCSKGHIFKTILKDRALSNSGCPYCSQKKFLEGFNDFRSLFPDIASEAYDWDPGKIWPHDKILRTWKCKDNHIWQGSSSNRIQSKATCPFCSGRKPIVGKNDLGITHPEIAAEADGWNPTNFRPGSGSKMNWKCVNNHKWKAIISSRTATNKQCPYCSGRYCTPGETDLLTKFPLIAAEADGWDASKVHFGSVSRKRWKCKQGHKWETSVSQRSKKKTNCPVCSNHTALKGFNDIGTTHPEIAAEAFEWDTSTVVYASHKKRQWKCKNSHIYEALVYQKTMYGGGCPYCSGQKTLFGFNDISTLHPEIALEADGWDPKLFVESSHRSVGWKCKYGHTWKSLIFSRTMNKQGCPVCSGHQVLIGFNDLLTTHPTIAEEADGWNPRTVSKGHSTKVKWKCKEGHKWSARPATRTAGFGCPTCSKSGFDPNSDGYLYFIEHYSWEMLQIGITNIPDDRLNDHRKLGWETLEIRGPMDGHLTQQWETAILRMLKTKGADLSNKEIAGKFDGYSEAWSKSTFPVKSIKELMKLTEEFEEGK